MRSKISKTLAALTATAMLIANYGSMEVHADDNFVSRFPGTNTSNAALSGSGADDSVTDENWVEHKDDDRHNIANTVGMANGTKGNASGPQSIELADGSWYWYHQSDHGCAHGMSADGSRNIGIMYLSSRSSNDSLRRMACGKYSTAMILSNLYGRPICIDDLVTQLGCTINGNKIQIPSGKGYIDTARGRSPEFAADVAETFELEYDAWNSERTKEESKAAIDACLDAGGMVRYRFGSSAACASDAAWPYRKTDGHFVVIRGKTEDGKYLILDPCEKFCSNREVAITRANTGVDWDTLWKHAGMDGYGGPWGKGFICFNLKGSSRLSSSTNTTGQTTAQACNWNSECPWYGPGSAIANYTDKKDLGEGFYLYNGLPWISDANTYTVDTDTALNDWFRYMETETGEKVTYGDGSEASATDIINNSNRAKEIEGDKLKGGSSSWKKKDGGSYAEVDGLQAVPICVPPMVVDTYFNSNFKESDKLSDDNWTNSNTASESNYNFGKSKMAVALYEKSTRKIWFMPVVTCSELEETYPGGVANTSFEVKSGDKVFDKVNKASKGKSTADYISTVAEFWDLPDAVKTVIGSKTDYAVCGYVVWE